MQSLNKRMAVGVGWMALLRLLVRLISLVSTVILARLLVPEDFGLVAMATSIVALLELMTAFSFDVPLIQNRDVERSHFDTAWTLNLMFFCAITIALLLMADFAAAFCRDERLVSIIYVLAFGFFFRGFENIGIVYFRKNLEFRREFIIQLGKKFVGFCIAIPLAFWLRSYWALVIGIVSGNVIGTWLTYMVHPFRPRLSMSKAREMLNFSKWLVLNNATGFLRLRSPDFVIGRLSGSSALGLFSVAYQIATLPTTELVAPINRAVFPGYAKVAGNQRLLQKSYLDVLAAVALIALPASLGLSAISESLVNLILGKNWLEATPLISILAIFGGVNAIQTNSGSVFNAVGKPYLITLVAGLHTIALIVGSIFLAIEFGALGVGYAYVIVFLTLSPLSFYLVCREINISFIQIVNVLARPIVSALIMYLVLVAIDVIWLEKLGVPSWGRLLTSVFVGTFVYALSIFAAWMIGGRNKEDAEFRLLQFALAAMLGRKRPAV